MIRLRHFVSKDRDGSSYPHTKNNASTIITGGANTRRTKNGDPTEIGFSLHTVGHGRDKDAWEQIKDDASDKSTAPMNDKRIYAERTYTVNHEPA